MTGRVEADSSDFNTLLSQLDERGSFPISADDKWVYIEGYRN